VARVLDYSPSDSHRARLARVVRKVCPIPLAFIGVIAFALFALLRGPTSVQIRLDTGDLRYCYFGVPVWWERLPEPRRTQLLSLSNGSSVLKPRWFTCAIFPLPTSNNTHLMCRSWYFDATVWIHEDPKLARWMLEDVAGYIALTNAKQGLPASSMFLSGFFVEPDDNGQWAVKKGWQADAEVQAYLEMKGNAPPANTPGR
jgi:hypothetical protein